jgi:hypothetical protein
MFSRQASTFALILFCAAGFGFLAAVPADEPSAGLKIIARKTLQGPSEWGLPADFRLIRSFTELVRAVGLDQANTVFEQWGEPKLDFERHMFVYVSAGSQRSSGYAVNIADVARRSIDGRPQVVVRWSLYEPKDYVLWVVTTPAELVMIERAEGEPTFKRVPFAETSGGDADNGKPAAEQVANGDEKPASSAVDWDALVREYDVLALPRPPADARPAALFHEMQLVQERDLVVPLSAPRYLLGFVTGGTNNRRFFVGTETMSISADDSDLTQFDPDQPFRGALVAAYDGNSFEIDVALPAAVECHRRGLKDLADQLLRSRVYASFEHPRSGFYQPIGLPPIVALRHVAWTHWGNKLTQKGADRAPLYGRMKNLVEREPTLSTPDRRALLESLSAALEPMRASAGTPERLIDDLVELDVLYFGRQGAVGAPAPIVELAKRGWDAMPALLAHLDDRRLTRSIVRPWDGSASYIPRVGELVSNLVQEMAGDEGLAWGRDAAGRFLSPKVIQPWWVRAAASGEEKYLVDNVLPEALEARSPYDPLVMRLSVAYPGRLPDVYRRSLAGHPDLNTWSLVSAIAAKSPLAVAVDLLAEGAAHPRVARQTEALEALSGLDVKRFEDLLVAGLPKLPSQPSGRYSLAEHVAFIRLCRKTERDDIWKALRHAMTSVDVGLRIEILDELGRTPKSPYTVWRRSIDLLAAFLDDESVRDTAADPEKYEGCAAAWLPTLQVRNWAAFQLATLLGVDLSAFREGKPITDDQWTKLRRDVRESRGRL